MKFMGKWTIHQDKWLPILKQWSSMTPQQRADAGPGVKILGRWHDFVGRRHDQRHFNSRQHSPDDLDRFVGRRLSVHHLQLEQTSPASYFASITRLRSVSTPSRVALT